MPVEDLKAKYGGKRVEAINRAIRAECPSGGDAIDLMSLTKQMCDRHGWEDDRGQPTPLAVVYTRAMDIVDAMEDDVRDRWGLPARDARDDRRRGGARRRGGGR